MVHRRIVYGFFDWLEAIGGVGEILKTLSVIAIGGLLSMHSTI